MKVRRGLWGAHRKAAEWLSPSSPYFDAPLEERPQRAIGLTLMGSAQVLKSTKKVPIATGVASMTCAVRRRSHPS
jgi:hypothetical protein